MKRVVKRVPLADGMARYISTITGDTAKSDMERRMQQQNMLRTLSDTPELWACGPAYFSSLKMRWGGESWIVEMEAVAQDVGG